MGIKTLNILACGLVIVSFCFAIYQLLLQPSTLNLIMLMVVALGVLRLAYEFTFNHGRIPTIASNIRVRRAISRIVQAHASGAATPFHIVDLGAGRGQLSRQLARDIPQAQVTGIELALIPYWRALWPQKVRRLPNLTFLRGDLFAYDCSHVNAVVMYVGKLTARVGEKLQRELAPGTLIVSNDFPLPAASWQLADQITIYTPFKTTVYVYYR